MKYLPLVEWTGVLILKPVISLMIKWLLLLLLPVCSFGQSSKSRVLDSTTRQPIPFATIRLYNHQQQLVHSTLADTSGRFIWSDSTIHFINISAAGYHPLQTAIGQADYFLPPLTKTLTGVTIIAQRPVISVRADGFTYDATQDVIIAGESTADLLQKLPGVQVDPNGSPSMRGSTRIKVFIDGKPSEAYAASVAEALRMIPPENIARIEVITHPSARYEGEGVDGVLQIYTKRPLTDGASGNISGYYQNRARNVTGNIAIRRKQWIITADAGYFFSNNLFRTLLTRTDNISEPLVQYIVRANKATNFNTALGITWLADSLNTFSIGFRPGKGWDHVYTQIDYSIGTTSFNRFIDNPYNRYVHPVNWSYIRKSKNKKGEFSFFGNWFKHYVESNYDLQQSSYKESNFTTVNTRELTMESNYTYSGLEAGVKTSFRRYRTTSIFIPDANRAQNFYFPRKIYAAYVSKTFKLKNYRIRTGVRYEQTVQSFVMPDTSFRIPDYKNLLPNILISRIFNEHLLTLGYSRKIFRPYLGYLSPIINYIDSLNISYGNPYLDPAVSNNYDLTYSFNKKEWLISANLFWYQTLRSIEAVALLKSGRIIERTYQNISSNTISGMSLQVTYRKGAVTGNINNNLRYVDFGYRSGWINNLITYVIYKFTDDFSVSAYLMYNSKRIDLQGSTTGNRYYNIWFNKSFKNGKYGISMRFDNLFMHYQTITEISQTDNFQVVSANQQIRRFFRFGFSYKFGKKEVRVPNAKNASSEN